MGTCCSPPVGSVRTTVALTLSCPSRKTVALISNGSPTTDLAGNAPCSMQGATRKTGMRLRVFGAAGWRLGARLGTGCSWLAVISSRLPGASLARRHGGASHAGGPPRRCPFLQEANKSCKNLHDITQRRLCFSVVKAIRRFSVRTVLPEPISALGELAINLRWCWHPATQDLFSGIDPKRWAKVQKEPAKMLSALSAVELRRLASDEAVVSRVHAAAEDLATYLSEPRWDQSWAAEVEGGAPASIAYFSPEYGITEALPQYSGGLGILAGDHLKTASDLGVPVIGVGLFYKTGYFKQSLNREGWQQETYPVLDPDDLPLALLREAGGEPCIVTIGLPGGRVLRAQVWKAQVGRVPLLLLDSNVRDNDDGARGITDRLLSLIHISEPTRLGKTSYA